MNTAPETQPPRDRQPPDDRLAVVAAWGGSYVTVRREAFWINGHEGVYLNEIYVPPEERRQGVATAMLEEVTRAADRHGRNIFLEPLAGDGPDRDALVAWYAQHGFQPIAATIYMRPFKRPFKPTLRRRLKQLLNRWRNRGEPRRDNSSPVRAGARSAKTAQQPATNRTSPK